MAVLVTNYTPGRKGLVPRAICNHMMMGTMNGTMAHFADPKAQVSANYGISLAGEIVQFVKDEDTAWANGPIRNPNLAAVPWIAQIQKEGINPNSVTISIEWEGVHRGGVWTTTNFNGEELNTLEHGSIHQFWVPTAAHYDAGVRLIRDLCVKWHIAVDRVHICRHSDFDSVSKWFCPGTGFPMLQLLADVQMHMPAGII